MSNACSQFWTSVGQALSQAMTPRVPATPVPVHDIGNDAQGPATTTERAATGATQSGGHASATQTTGTCPLCKVAIMVGHNSSAPGATSLGMSEFEYNTDIATRTVAKIAEIGEGRVTAQVFNRTAGSNELTRAYAPVHTFLEGVPTDKKIAIELHYNSAGATSARRSEVIYKGAVGFAQTTCTAMAGIFGGGTKLIPWDEHPRGRATFTNGPANTYLMEPFFGSNPASREIALTDAAKDELAEVYARALVNWTR